MKIIYHFLLAGLAVWLFSGCTVTTMNKGPHGYKTYTVYPADKDLIDAVMENNCTKTTQMLRMGANPNSFYYLGLLGKMQEIGRGTYHAMTQNYGAFLDMKEEKMFTIENFPLLVIAALRGESCIATALLDHGADPNAWTIGPWLENKARWTDAVSEAFYSNHRSIATQLLAKGADPCQTTEKFKGKLCDRWKQAGEFYRLPKAQKQQLINTQQLNSYLTNPQ